MQINAPIQPGFETILTRPALALVAKLHRAFEPRRQELLAARVERAKRARRRRAPRLPGRDAGASATATGRSRRCRRRCSAAASRSPARSTRKMVINAFNSGADSYMTDFEDSNSPDVGQPDPGPDQPGRRDPPHADARAETGGTRATSSTTRSPRCRCARAAGTSTRSTCSVDGQRVSGGIFDFAPVHVPQREGAARARRRPVLLPAQDGEPSRGAAVERHLRRAQDELGLPQGTIKATVLIETILAAFEMDEILYELREHSRRPERRPLGLHLQLHQEVQARPRLLPRRPRQGHDDRAVHARLRAAAAQDLPPARRAGDRRHERADPDQERSGEERDRDGRRSSHDKQRDATDGYDGGWVAHPGLVEAGDEGIPRGARRQAEPVGASSARRARHGGRPARLPARDADHRGRPAQQHQRRHPLPRRLARAATAACRSTT